MSTAAVHVEGLTQRFGATVALAGLDLDVEAETVFGLLGPNGGGKTTLVSGAGNPARARRKGRASPMTRERI